MNQEEENNGAIDLSKPLGSSGEESQYEVQSSEQVFRPGTPKIIQCLIEHSGGLVKNERQAQYLIFGFIALMVIISLFLVFGGDGEEFTPEEQLYLNTPSSQINP